MKVQVEDVSSIEKRLSIEVEPALVDKELTAAYANLSKQVKLPGFRPGKVPRRILEQRFGGEVEADVVRRVQLLGFIDALKQVEVAAVGDPSFSSAAKLEPQKPYAYTARVEVKPAVTAQDYKGLELAAPDATVDEAKVNEQLERLQGQRTQVIDVTDRDVVKQGDLVTIDFDATKDGQAFPGNTGRDVTVEVAPGSLLEGNVPELEGAKKGEQKAWDFTFPEDYRVDEVKGAAAHFVATVKAIKERKVPALDDALAKELGDETLDALKKRVRADLERAAKNRAEADAREAVFKALEEKNRIDVPQAMVNRAIDFMLENALGGLMRSGMDPNMLQLDWSKLRDELRPKATLEVRGQLLLEAIAKAENIEATDADVEARMEQLAKENDVGLPILQKQYRTPEAKDGLKHRVKEEKTIAFLRDHAKKS